MPPKNPRRTTINDAVERVARAIATQNGEESVGPLAASQRRLIDHHVSHSGEQYRANTRASMFSIMPGTVSYTVGGISWKRYPSDPQLRAEVEKALYQHDVYEEQCGEAENWLKSQGFNINARSLDCRQLDRAMASAFGLERQIPPAGSAQSRENTSASRKTVTINPKKKAAPKKEKIISNMRAAVQSGNFTWSGLERMPRKTLVAEYGMGA